MPQTARSEARGHLLPDLLAVCERGVLAAERLVALARAAVLRRVGRVDGEAFEREQVAAHGLAWYATYAAALREMLGWARRLEGVGRLGELESLMLQAAFGEYLSQMVGGIAMSQGEIVRPADLGVDAAGLESETLHGGNTALVRRRIAQLIAEGRFGDAGLADDTLAQIKGQFRRVADDHREEAHRWHLEDALIPLPVVGKLAGLGVFGLTVPEEYGGSGLGKLALSVMTEELSRGFLGLGSLGTRSEIAAELIRFAGTEEQKRRWLPGIAAGRILPTAVFTEPGVGSDLGAVKTRAVREGAVYRITGNKTWITHAARADLMTLLARTQPAEAGYKGLSMFLAPKPRGTESDPFPVPGLAGSEIAVLGYRGMKEYELAFDGFAVAAENLLGGVEGHGFKQLMATFEAARIQTAARAVGVAEDALELALEYARSRVQFGKPIYAFPRVSGKIAWMAVETMVARQLTHHAARQKDAGRRCDIEAGMAKLLAARVAWANADNAVQVHGGNGYAAEFKVSRVLLDARILNIFEGAAEIQAQVIAKGLLGGRN